MVGRVNRPAAAPTIPPTAPITALPKVAPKRTPPRAPALKPCFISGAAPAIVPPTKPAPPPRAVTSGAARAAAVVATAAAVPPISLPSGRSSLAPNLAPSKGCLDRLELPLKSPLARPVTPPAVAAPAIMTPSVIDRALGSGFSVVGSAAFSGFPTDRAGWEWVSAESFMSPV